MSIETISEEGQEDYELWTCDDCGYSITLNGVGGDVCECPRCLEKEYKTDAEEDAKQIISEETKGEYLGSKTKDKIKEGLLKKALTKKELVEEEKRLLKILEQDRKSRSRNSYWATNELIKRNREKQEVVKKCEEDFLKILIRIETEYQKDTRQSVVAHGLFTIHRIIGEVQK